MLINGKEYSVNQLVDELKVEKDFIKKRNNGFLLSDNMISILEKYHIDYKKFNNIKSLIFEIESYINESFDEDIEDLEIVSERLAEYDYYNNTNK